MAVEVILPRVDMDMTAGKIGQWFFDEGARVEKGQPLFEIETDKAAMEIEAPASGVLRGVVATTGEELPVGSIVGWIYAPDEPYDLARAETGAPAIAETAPLAAEVGIAITPGDPAARQGDSTDLRATPLARRIARQAGVDLSQVVGSGPHGRIQARDVASQNSPPAPADERHAINRVWLARGTGAPLVLIHGFGADLNGWRPMVARLGGARPILALDLPGHGNSKLVGSASFDTLVDAIAAALVEERVAAAHLVGHSLGGAVASALVERRSVDARSLMLVAPAGLGPDINGAFIAGFLRARSEASLAAWMRLLATDEASLGSAMVKTTLRQRADLQVGEAQEQIAAALFPDGAQAFSVHDHLTRVAVPAKIVFGLDDQIIPPRHARGLPGVIGVHLFPGVGHMPHLEARGEVARLVTELAAAGD
jgi:pimeloyl-ACP methyl ester carboxylesterase